MKMIDLTKEREAFEAWLIKKFDLPPKSFSLDFCDGTYESIPTQARWEAWIERAKAQAVQAWISVKEQLPELETEVLVVFKGNIIQAGLYQGEEGLAWWSELLDGWDLDFEKVTCWKPLIEFPSESGAAG